MRATSRRLFLSFFLNWTLFSCVHAQALQSSQLPQPELPANPVSVSELTDSFVSKTAGRLQRIRSQTLPSLEISGSDNSKTILEKSRALFALNLAAQQRLAALWTLRRQIMGQVDEQSRVEIASRFLELTTHWINFTGELRFEVREQARGSSRRLPRNQMIQLIESARRHRSGAVIPSLAFVLVTPPPQSKAKPFDEPTRLALLRLIKETQDFDSARSIYQLLRWPHTPDELLIRLADALTTIGISQRLETDQLEMTGEELLERIEATDTDALSASAREMRESLVRTLSKRIQRRNDTEGYRFGPVTLRPGDWILQRNPSPYNRFTDLSPGLFTHVGIVVNQVDKDGKTKTLIVDLPETGTQIEASEPGEFVSRSLHWMILRHTDREACSKMAEVASGLIGRGAEFDLTFNMALIPQQRGVAESSAPVRTYCAGFLALCAQEAGLRQQDLFPIVEHPTNKQCQENLAAIGLPLTEFISPTSPLFSDAFEIVGTRLPLYSPNNTIKEAVYDRFAERLAKSEFELHQTTAQKLRQQLADISSEYTWVRQALASFNNVNPSMDLVTAARVATIVENLDLIADEQAQLYYQTFQFATKKTLPQDGEQATRTKKLYAQIQSELTANSSSTPGNRISTQRLRQILVVRCCTLGERRVDEMFFKGRN